MEHHLTTYITHDTLISALGFGTQENLEAIRSYHSGITLQTDKRIADTPLLAATLSQERLQQQADRKSTRLNSSHSGQSRMPSSA